MSGVIGKDGQVHSILPDPARSIVGESLVAAFPVPDVLDPKIVRDSEDSRITHAANGVVTMSVLEGGRVFKRNAIKRAGTPAAERVTWLVAELNGVRVYVNGDKLIVSTQDLYP